MKVTVAIITRNRAQQLERCLNSLVIQTVKPNHVLVVDSSSTDESKKIVRKFTRKLTVKYIFEERLGYSHARNRALDEVKTDILAFTDDDCEVSSNWIRNIQRSHSKYKEIAIQGWFISKPVNSLISIIVQNNHESGYKEKIIFKDKNGKSEDFLKKARKILLLNTRNASFKAHQLKKLGVRFNVDWLYAEDYELAMHLLSKNQQIIFEPCIKIYHWERTSLLEFISQRYSTGRGVAQTQLYWPILNNNPKPFWWLFRIKDFFNYIVEKGYYSKALPLIALFILDKIIYLSAKVITQICCYRGYDKKPLVIAK